MTRRRGRVLGGLAVTMLWAALASSASAVVVHTTSGRFFGVAPRPGVTVSRSAGAALHAAPNVAAVTSTGALEYHGGPVLHTTRPYLIFWDPAGTAIDPTTRALFSRYLTDVAADNALGDDVFGVTRQYTDATGYAASGESYGAAQEIADGQPYPAIGRCSRTPAPITVCLTDAQLQAELARLISAGGLPSGTGPGAPVYFVITPATVNVCLTGSECADNYFCAYHANVVQNGGDVIYAAIPLLNAVKDCQVDGNSALQDPNGIPADVALDNLSHEYNESISDPNGDAWYDSGSDNEEADYCQEYGATRDPVAGSDPHAYAPVLGTAANGSLFDQRIAGDPYYTQSEWSNGQADCELAPAPGTLSSTIIGPQTVSAGTPVTVAPGPTTATNGVASTTWSFGDGSGAYGVGAPTVQTHTYAVLGVYTVSMTLVDRGGQVATATRPVTVAIPPVAAFTQSTALAGAPFLTHVTFDASGSNDPNPGAHIVSYRWEFGDGVISFQGPTTGYSYATPGSYTVKLTVISSDGLSASVTRPIRVVAVPGVKLSWEAAYPVAGRSIAFDGAPNPAGLAQIVSYRWDFGDGANRTGAHVTHTFRRPGAYWVSLALTTADGLSRVQNRLLHVHPVEAITKLALSTAPAGAVRLKVTVNGPGRLSLAGRSYTLAKAGSISRALALTRGQRRALRRRGRLIVLVPVRFRPLVGRAISRTARLTLTG
ncbi:MAG: PKD domain-containing protein [Solirubrobacteraceae bacterium]